MEIYPIPFTSRVQCEERPPNIDEVPLGQSYILSPDPNAPFSSYIESCGHELQERDYWWEGSCRKLESVTIQYTLSGKGFFRLGKKEFELSAGKAVLFESPGAYAYGLKEASPHWRFIFVTLIGEAVIRVWQWLMDQVGPIISLESQSESVVLMCEICRRSSQGIFDNDMLSADYSNRLVFSLCEELLHKDAFTHLPDALVAAQEFIRQHLSENIGLEDVAKSAGVSVSYLGSLFRQYLNCTPRGEIERQRINRCKVLLSTTQMPITDIALGSGYRDSGYFSRVFHRIHRMSPSAFREQKLQ